MKETKQRYKREDEIKEKCVRERQAASPINKELVGKQLLPKLKQATVLADLLISLYRKFKCN
jgi:hypothetical protein